MFASRIARRADPRAERPLHSIPPSGILPRMRKILAATILSVACTALAADARQQAEPKYEMTTYVLGLLVKGPNWTAESTPETKRIQEGHMANIRKMAETGRLVVAGPISDGGDLRGIFIFQGVTIEEARRMAEADPAIESGRLKLNLHPWFAAKGLKVDPPK